MATSGFSLCKAANVAPSDKNLRSGEVTSDVTIREINACTDARGTSHGLLMWRIDGITVVRKLSAKSFVGCNLITRDRLRKAFRKYHVKMFQTSCVSQENQNPQSGLTLSALASFENELQTENVMT